MPRNLAVPYVCPESPATMARQRCNFRYGARMDIGYARVSTAKQELTRQLDALAAAGVDPAHIHVDKKSGATMARPGLQRGGTTSDTMYNHYSLLASIEDIFSVPRLGYAGAPGLNSFGPDVFNAG